MAGNIDDNCDTMTNRVKKAAAALFLASEFFGNKDKKHGCDAEKSKDWGRVDELEEDADCDLF